MRQYKHVLAPIDFSDLGELAAEQAVDLARRYHARLLLLHVLEHFPEHLPRYRMAREEMDPGSCCSTARKRTCRTWRNVCERKTPSSRRC